MIADKAWPSYAETPPKLIAGAPGLDFANTVEWRGDPAAQGERLISYAELAHWCAGAGLIGTDEACRLARQATRWPRRAERSLARAIRLRETLVSILRAPEARSDGLAALNRLLDEARYRLRLSLRGDGGYRAESKPDGALIDRPLEAVALAVVSLLTEARLDKVRACGDPRCGWLFIDSSRNAARRWCDMAGCGNRAKARAHQARRRAADS